MSRLYFSAILRASNAFRGFQKGSSLDARPFGVRQFARYIKNNEPERGVHSEFDLNDPAPFKLAFVREHTREEMWRLHKSDPNQWTWLALSQKYNMAIERVRAILILMEHREAAMKERNVLELSENWDKIWNMHTADATVNTKEVIAEAVGVTVEEVDKCVSSMTAHTERLKIVAEYMQAYEQYAEHVFGAKGVDINFREAIDKSKKIPKQFEDSFKPLLVTDDQFEDHKKYLLKRILALTKASVDKSVIINDFLASTEERVAKSKDILLNGVPSDITNYKMDESKIVRDFAKEKTIPALDKDEGDVAAHFEDGDAICRWKFAFRDISKNAREQNAPTMIRTRRGMWRIATPLEELNRTWQRKPTGVEAHLYMKNFDKYVDPDGDDAIAKRFLNAKKERRRQLQEQMSK